jgi:beta-lactamase class A
MDAVDHKKWKLDTRIRIERKDLSLNVQPLADLVGPDGFETTLGDLVRRATVDSDSAATDILIDRLGGVKEVQGFLDRKGIRGIRIDRDERQLQTETTGVVWRPEFVDPKILSAARAAVPEPLREAAYRKYQSDIRDTSTPDAMAGLLLRLGQGKLLSPRSTSFFLEVMEQTITFPNRLKAGLIEGWRLGHKTGSSGSYKGLTVATNDVGILRGPGGAVVSIVVFLGDSTESDERKSALMAALSRATILHTR